MKHRVTLFTILALLLFLPGHVAGQGVPIALSDAVHKSGSGDPNVGGETCANIDQDRYTDTATDLEWYCSATDTWTKYPGVVFGDNDPEINENATELGKDADKANSYRRPRTMLTVIGENKQAAITVYSGHDPGASGILIGDNTDTRTIRWVFDRGGRFWTICTNCISWISQTFDFDTVADTITASSGTPFSQVVAGDRIMVTDKGTIPDEKTANQGFWLVDSLISGGLGVNLTNDLVATETGKDVLFDLGHAFFEGPSDDEWFELTGGIRVLSGEINFDDAPGAAFVLPNTATIVPTDPTFPCDAAVDAGKLVLVAGASVNAQVAGTYLCVRDSTGFHWIRSGGETIPNGTDCPTTCVVGQTFMDTDGTTSGSQCDDGQASFNGGVCGCYAADTWGCP